MAIVQMPAQPGKGRGNKFNARKTWIDDPLTGAPLLFDSQGEAGRYCELCIRVRAGEISDLRRQVPYIFFVNGVRIATYEADFVYWDVPASEQVVEDFKSQATKTQTYLLKKKLMLACYGITIRESGAPAKPRSPRRKKGTAA
jgi:hypothetical protein